LNMNLFASLDYRKDGVVLEFKENTQPVTSIKCSE